MAGGGRSAGGVPSGPLAPGRMLHGLRQVSPSARAPSRSTDTLLQFLAAMYLCLLLHRMDLALLYAEFIRSMFYAYNGFFKNKIWLLVQLQHAPGSKLAAPGSRPAAPGSRPAAPGRLQLLQDPGQLLQDSSGSGSRLVPGPGCFTCMDC